MPVADHIEKHRLLVGGEPVAFTRSTATLRIGGRDYTIEEWKEVTRQIGLLHDRKSERKAAHGRDPNHGSSSFLTANLNEIHRRQRGMIQDSPWWLRWLYGGVITKEVLRAD